MKQSDVDAFAIRMQQFVDHLGEALGSKPQRKRFADYAPGLLLPGSPMADADSAAHQRHWHWEGRRGYAVVAARHA